MSPSGDKLRLRCSFPGLISNCVIDWSFPGRRRCGNRVFFEVDLPDAHRANIVQTCFRTRTGRGRFVRKLRRYYYVTPKNYLDYTGTTHRYNEKKVRISAF